MNNGRSNPKALWAVVETSKDEKAKELFFDS
jgi:hypothetical protein